MSKFNLAPFLAFLLTLLPAEAYAGCSAYIGLATINELNKDRSNGNDDASDFIEVKILDTSIPLSVYGTWTLTLQENGGQGPAVFPLSEFEDTTIPWLVQSGLDVAIFIDLDAGMNVILKDGSGDVIDYLDYDTSDSFTALADGSCSSFVFDTTIASSSGGTKRISRSPDGIGAWGAVTAQSEAPTENTTNDDVPSGAPTASAANLIVAPGADATFTVTLSAAPSSDVIINYSTQDGTATAGSDYTSASGTVTIASGQGPLLDQYATTVEDFSSEWENNGPVDYRASQTLGVSDTFSYGDIKTSWAPLTANAGVEYITVKFSTPVYSTGVTIRETWGNGFVTQIEALDVNNTLNTVWSGTDDSAPGSPVDFLASWTQTDYLVDGVKITIDTTHNTGTWEEIDSIQLHGYSSGPTAAQFTITTSSTALGGEVFTVLLSSDNATVLTSLATATFSIATACGLIDTTYGIYSTSNITIGSDVTMNGSSVASGTTAGDVGISQNGTITTSSITIPGLDPTSFPSNSSAINASEADSPISSDVRVYYNDITVSANQSLTFTGQGPFHINNFTVEDEADIYLSAGTYYINNLIMKERTHIRLNSAPVALHIGSDMDLGDKRIHINQHDGGDPEDLSIYLHSNATISGAASNDGSQIKAIIIGVDNGEIEFGKKLRFDGVILSDNDITIGDDSDLDLTNVMQSAIGLVSTCDVTGGGSDLDHFIISHDGTGINCIDEVITVTAMSSTPTPLTGYTEQVVLTTQSGTGTWTLSSGAGSFLDVSADDGLAVYTYSTTDNGVAVFNLSYQQGIASLDVDAYQFSDTALRDDDTESSLVFSPSGFTFTQSVLSNPPPTPIVDPIVTQTAGSNFNLHITAFGQTEDDPICGVIEAYDGAKPLSFWFDYGNPSSGTVVPTIDTNPITSSEGASSSQSVTFASGQAVVIGKYKDVGQIQVHAKDGTIAGSTDSFVSRPADLFISDIETVPGVNNPAASAITGTRFVAAGEAFTVVVEARDAENSLTPNFGNESLVEGIEIVAALTLPLGGINGSANDGSIGNGSSFSATTPSGTFTGSAFSWDEYGIITLQASIADDSYLGTGEVSGTVSGNVGRFYAASYTLVSGAVSASCNGMTYMDETAIFVSYDIEAQNVGNNKLSNYDSALLGGNVVTPAFNAENNNAGVNLNSRIPLTSSSWNNGSYSLPSNAQVFNRAVNPDGPYESLQLGVSINDTIDNFDIENADMNPITDTDCTSLGNCTAKAIGSPTSVRYGRLQVSNNFGPETEPLDIALSANYLDATGSFVVNTDDDCSAYIRTGATLSNYQSGLPVLTVTSPASSTLFIDGEPIPGIPLLLSAPGAGNDGSVDVTVDAPIWLEYDWSGGGDEDPKGTASFGHFRGHDRVIYWREVF